MSTIKVLDYGAKDSATGAPIAGKFMTGGDAIVNSFSVGTTDATATGLTPFAVGEAPAGPISTTSYLIADPQAGVIVPTWIRVLTSAGAGPYRVTMPQNAYDGMVVTVSDVGNAAATNEIAVSGFASDQIEGPVGTFSGGFAGLIQNNSGSITWRYIAGSPGVWKITAKV